MDNRFVCYTELLNFLKQKVLREDLESRSTIGVCSVSDLLYLTEEYKKNTYQTVNTVEDDFKKFQDGPKERGQIIVAELSKEQLEDALFDSSSGDIQLWNHAANSNISPRHSMNLLILKITDFTWWNEEVFEQMKEAYELGE